MTARDAEHWSQQAACQSVDPELFFTPEGVRGPAVRERELLAKAVCAGCPVKMRCRREAEQHRLAGVWGGTTEEERRRTPEATAVCGTADGWNRHKRNGTRQCPACLTYERNRQEEVALRNWRAVQPLLEQGLTREQAAAELGVNVHTVRKAHQAAMRAARRDAEPDADRSTAA